MPEDTELRLNTAIAGRKLVYLSQTDSTNEEARRLAAQGAPSGTVVVAEYQTAGRGRLGRSWHAPPRSSILMSILLRPSAECSHVQRVTMACALAVVDAIEAECGLRVHLKWPNDLVLEGEKLGGVLTELGFSGNRVDFVVVGIGVNVNLDPAQLPGPLLLPASSLSSALGRAVDRMALIVAMIDAIERRYLALESGSPVHEEWERCLATLGQHVTVSVPGGTVTGLAEGVDADGALLVRLTNGSVRRIVAGDVAPGNCSDWHDAATSAMMCNVSGTK